MLLSLSSIFQDFFDTPEDDPLLQGDSASDGSPDSADNRSSTPSEDDARDNTSVDDPMVGGDGASSDADADVPSKKADTGTSESGTSGPEVALPEGLSSDVLRHGISEEQQTETPAASSAESHRDDSAPQRTKKFVVPYNASTEELEEINEAISSGWSFRRIAVTKTRASVKPEGKKVIITLEQTKPRSLFDF